MTSRHARKRTFPGAISLRGAEWTNVPDVPGACKELRGEFGIAKPCSRPGTPARRLFGALNVLEADGGEVVGGVAGERSLGAASPCTAVGDPGLEPGTSSLSEKRSNQLS